MSLQRNIIANYISQIYVAAVGILILPLYIQYMGAEAYGLVGFFTMLQAWFGLLDMGLTPTIGRETARYKGGSMSALEYRQLFRALSSIFIFIALIGGGSLFFFSEFISTQWLNVSELGMEEVVVAVQIMAISVALRWLGGLYRGVITGSEKLVWLSAFNALVATLRFIAVFVTMSLYGFTPFVFFMHQLVVAIIEVTGLFLMNNRLLPPKAEIKDRIGWSIEPVKPVLKFALTIAFTSSVWVLVTQTDKLVLSGILPLDEYGYFTLAVLVASGIMIISGPISSAIMPRMARLYAEGRSDEVIAIYRNSTQVVSVISGAVSVTIACCSTSLLYAWTGDLVLSEKAAPILSLYALGNGILAVAAFPYYLQYAKGNLRYHLIGNAVMVCLLIPAIIFAATYYGGVGAGYVWLFMNAFFLLTWIAYVHYKLEPGLHLQWLLKDILSIYIPMTLIAMQVMFFPFESLSRLSSIAYVVVIGIALITVAALGSSLVRNFVWLKLKKIG